MTGDGTGDTGDAEDAGDTTRDAGNFLRRKFPEPFKEFVDGL